MSSHPRPGDKLRPELLKREGRRGTLLPFGSYDRTGQYGACACVGRHVVRHERAELEAVAGSSFDATAVVGGEGNTEER